MKRTWVVAPLIIVLSLAVMAGVAVVTLRLVDRPEPAERSAGPKDLCDLVKTEPLARVPLAEPNYRRTVRQAVVNGHVMDSCLVSLEMPDVPQPEDSFVSRRSASLDVHVTRYPDAATAADEFRSSKRYQADEGTTDTADVRDQAYINYRELRSSDSSRYQTIELVVQRGERELRILLSATRASDWNRDAARTALVEVAQRIL